MSYWMEKLKTLMAPQVTPEGNSMSFRSGPMDAQTMMTGHPAISKPVYLGGKLEMPMGEHEVPYPDYDAMLSNPAFNPVADGMPVAGVSETLPEDPSTLTPEAKAKLEKPVEKKISSLEDIKNQVRMMESIDSIKNSPTPTQTPFSENGMEERVNKRMKEYEALGGKPAGKQPTLEQRVDERLRTREQLKKGMSR